MSLIDVVDGPRWEALPKDAEGLLLYTDGHDPFPIHRLVEFTDYKRIWWITAVGNDFMADVINGDAVDVSTVVEWVLTKREMGIPYPIVFATPDKWYREITVGFQAINRVLPSWWASKLDSNHQIPQDAYATQYLQCDGYNLSVAPYSPPQPILTPMVDDDTYT